VILNYDLENNPLEIMTDSVLGSNDRLYVSFYSAGGPVGTVSIYFRNNSVQYAFGYCSGSHGHTPFTSQLPSKTDKIWKITLIRTSSITLKIYCNGVELVNVVLSDTTCSDNRWSITWSRDVEKIQFSGSGPSGDNASDHYRPYTDIGE
jgi:hypothetical protein